MISISYTEDNNPILQGKVHFYAYVKNSNYSHQIVSMNMLVEF